MSGYCANKPPLGVMPQKIWYDKVRVGRLIDLSEAIIRYANTGKEIPVEWVEERNQLIVEVGEQVSYESIDI